MYHEIKTKEIKGSKLIDHLAYPQSGLVLGFQVRLTTEEMMMMMMMEEEEKEASPL